MSEKFKCVICLKSCTERLPCLSCKGSMGIHETCLNRFISHSYAPKNLNQFVRAKCPVCSKQFTVRCVSELYGNGQYIFSFIRLCYVVICFFLPIFFEMVVKRWIHTNNLYYHPYSITSNNISRGCVRIFAYNFGVVKLSKLPLYTNMYTYFTIIHRISILSFAYQMAEFQNYFITLNIPFISDILWIIGVVIVVHISKLISYILFTSHVFRFEIIAS